MSAAISTSSSHNEKPLLIVLSHLRWDFVFQRPQHLLTRAAADFRVVFVEEPLYEGEVRSSRELDRTGGVRVVQPLLPPGTDHDEALSHQGDIAEAIAADAGTTPVYLWYYTPMALAFGHRIDADLVIFDKMDELSAFAFAPPELSRLEASLMETADVVFTGGASLHAAAAGRNPNTHCFPSSIDVAHFGQARDVLHDPSDQAAIAHPRLGFFGVIDERLDLALVADVAALHPDWQLVMVGPTAKIDPAALPKAPNIHWLGPKSYAELPDYLSGWDLGWMPFARNESTRFISPTKTPEFLAAGLPLMSTPIQDVVEPYGRLGLVEIVTNAPAAVEAGERLLAEAGDSRSVTARLAAVDHHLTGNSWDATWASIRAAMLAAIQNAELRTMSRTGGPVTRNSPEAELV